MDTAPIEDGYVCGWCGEARKNRLTARIDPKYQTVYVRCEKCIDEPFIEPYSGQKRP